MRFKQMVTAPLIAALVVAMLPAAAAAGDGTGVQPAHVNLRASVARSAERLAAAGPEAATREASAGVERAMGQSSNGAGGGGGHMMMIMSLVGLAAGGAMTYVVYKQMKKQTGQSQ